MPFITAFNKHQEKIKQVKVPEKYSPRIPVAVCHEEALRTYQVSCRYETELCQTDIDFQIVREIPERVAASMDAQSRWLACTPGSLPIEKEWKKENEKARKFREEIRAELAYYFGKMGFDAFEKKYKAGYVTIDTLPQDFLDFGVLIQQNSSALVEAGMDISIGKKAALYSEEISDLYARKCVDYSFHRTELKRVRNQTLLYLLQAVEQVQNAAAYRFKKEPDILNEFSSDYRRNHRVKNKAKAGSVKENGNDQ